MRRTALVLMIGTAPAALVAQSSVQVSPFPAQPDQVRWLDPSTGSWEAQNGRRDPITLRVPEQATARAAERESGMGAGTWRVVPQTLRPAPPIEGGACLLAKSSTGGTVRALALPSVESAQTVVVLETAGDRLLTSREYRYAAPVALRTMSTDGATTLTGLPAGVPFDVVGVDHRTERFMSARVEGDRAIPLRSGDVRETREGDPHRELVARALDARRRCAATGG